MGFRLTKTMSLMDLNSPIFRLNKTFFYRKLFNIETRRERLSKNEQKNKGLPFI